MVNSGATLLVCLTGRVVKCPRPVLAGRRERRRPAEATPLCATRRWTRLLRKFTGGAWERQAPPRGAPSGATPPAGRGRTWAIHPATLSRLLRGVASRDQPLERLRYAPPPAAGRGLVPGVGHGSLPCAATAQQTKQRGVAGTPPPFGSASGPSRWFSGRPLPRLGPRVSGSFPSDLAIHGNRTGGRSAGAARSACLDLGIEAAPMATAPPTPATVASQILWAAQPTNAGLRPENGSGLDVIVLAKSARREEGDFAMRRKRYTDEQIGCVVCQAETGWQHRLMCPLQHMPPT